MASRWFVFWIACWVVAELKDGYGTLGFLFLAAITSDPAQEVIRKLVESAGAND